MESLDKIRCEHDGVTLEGVIALPKGAGPHPTVMVMHSALGLHHMVADKVRQLAGLGYLAVGTDMYGIDADTSSGEAAGSYFVDLAQNPEKLRARTVAWFDTVSALANVDSQRIAAIGYCFGGMCVLELARSGVDVKAAVSYHGILKTHAPARAGAIRGEVAAYCGMKDPYAPPVDIENLRQELLAAGVNYQIAEFGEAAHGFTDPNAATLDQPGIAYHPIADRVSWSGTVALLEATLAA